MIRTPKLEDEPAIEVHPLQVPTECRPVEESVSRWQVIVESPVMIVRMDVRESRAGDFEEVVPLMSQRGVTGVETDRDGSGQVAQNPPELVGAAPNQVW